MKKKTPAFFWKTGVFFCLPLCLLVAGCRSFRSNGEAEPGEGVEIEITLEVFEFPLDLLESAMRTGTPVASRVLVS